MNIVSEAYEKQTLQKNILDCFRTIISLSLEDQ